MDNDNIPETLPEVISCEEAREMGLKKIFFRESLVNMAMYPKEMYPAKDVLDARWKLIHRTQEERITKSTERN